MTFDYHSATARPRGRPIHPPASADAPHMPRLRFLPREQVEACATFRDACVLAWKSRTHPGMTETYLAAVCDLTQQHVSEYFQVDERDEKGRKRRQLPADKVGAVQEQLGNCAIGQWLARDMAVRLVEEFFAAESVR
ncbi:MAG: XRE family transcriptional regulator [Paraburkholderia sp.]|uniref:XRE family transcriptional regulator n=1 Tax=Burkholderiaceae TaxID=119060 RepID=UPI0010F9DB80|nr:XRE family transcriptional regulator [Burkholderia sp. 4M9327F10]